MIYFSRIAKKTFKRSDNTFGTINVPTAHTLFIIKFKSFPGLCRSIV